MATNLVTIFEAGAGAVLRYSGLFSLLRLVQGHKVPILTYHSISPVTGGGVSCMALAESETSIERFRTQMAYIARHYDTISLQDFVEWHSGKKQLPPNACVITFDDGFANLYENALAILQELDLKATFFIIGGSLACSQPSWLHELYGILDSVPVQSCLSAFGKEVPDFPANQQFDKVRLWAWVRRYFMELDRETRCKLLENLRVHFDNPERNKSGPFMTADQVARLSAEGFEIGSHSMRHELLSRLTDDQLEDDIRESKQIISNTINREPQMFCYPFGSPDSWDERAVAILKKNGFACACSTVQGLCDRNNNLFALCRINVSDNIPLSAFVFRLVGLRKWLIKIKLLLRL